MKISSGIYVDIDDEEAEKLIMEAAREQVSDTLSLIIDIKGIEKTEEGYRVTFGYETEA